MKKILLSVLFVFCLLNLLYAADSTHTIKAKNSSPSGLTLIRVPNDQCYRPSNVLPAQAYISDVLAVISMSPDPNAFRGLEWQLKDSNGYGDYATGPVDLLPGSGYNTKYTMNFLTTHLILPIAIEAKNAFTYASKPTTPVVVGTLQSELLGCYRVNNAFNYWVYEHKGGYIAKDTLLSIKTTHDINASMMPTTTWKSVVVTQGQDASWASAQILKFERGY